MTCFSCGGQTVPWTHMPFDPMKGTENTHKDFVVCTECGLGAISPMPSPEEIQSFYDTARYYTHGLSHLMEVNPTLLDRALHHAAWRFDKGQSLDPQRIAKDLPPGASICDLGCGNGELLSRFRALGFRVVGVEPDARARAEAAKAGVTVLAGTCEELPADLKGQSCDLVIMSHVLEHCRDPILALQKAFFLTRPGGMLFCEVPNCAATHFKSLGVCSAMFDAPRHLYFFTPACLRTAINLSGFTFSGFQYMGYTRHHHVSWRQWEASIYDQTREYSGRPSGRRHTVLRSIQLLLSTAFASDEKKYDSVAVYGRRPDAPEHARV